MDARAMTRLCKAVESLEKAVSHLSKGAVPNAADARAELKTTNKLLAEMRGFMKEGE